ncbi:hypothetical protein DPEC_G00030020 [Dallia pectoralis]|uniref:Uncharacterized protein n=1 Tax=Dallia pectoralis TaxID=75939 RepID=A0ACC2HCM1_DALPE|nr:hypothetical protein DPEC_G00030020 [Dallia pectoralis]
MLFSRPEPTVEIAFIRCRSSPSSASFSSSPQSPITPQDLTRRTAAVPATRRESLALPGAISPSESRRTTLLATLLGAPLLVAKIISNPGSEALPSGNHSQPSLSDIDDLEGTDRLRKDHTEALTEIKRLQEQLAESKKLNRQRQKELNTVKQDQVEELKKKMFVLECQLRKNKLAKKGLEVSTGKLLNFVEIVQDFLVENHSSLKNYRSGEMNAAASSPPLGTRPGKKVLWTSSMLAAEAKELIKTVRGIIEVDCESI